MLLTGFLFGFPMGSKNCAELLKAGKLEKEEADLLFIITNNISPVFISSYILCQELNTPSLIGISYLILYLPPLILGAFWCRFFSRSGKTAGQEKTPTSGSQMNFKIIDAGIMNGFETLTRLGGYIMLFSIFASILTELPLCLPIKTLLIGITEITNGIHQLPSSGYPGSDLLRPRHGFYRLWRAIRCSTNKFHGKGLCAFYETISSGKDTARHPFRITRLWCDVLYETVLRFS